MLKVKVFENNIKANLDDDFIKAVKYFKEKGLDFVFERQKTNVKLKDKEVQLALPNDGKCDVVMYLFDRKSQPTDGYSRCVKFSRQTSLVWIPTGTEEDAINWHWTVICHELMHHLFYALQEKGVFLKDPMDNYEHNDDPYHPTGNFSQAWKLLLPYFNTMYKPKNFTLKELVSPATYGKYGEKAWEFLDERMLRNLQYIRDSLGRPITVNNSTLQYRCFDAIEYRKEGFSQHNHGRAVDFDVRGMTAHEVREWLKTNSSKLPEPNIWVEDGVGWVHMDCRYSDFKGLHLFKP